MTTDREHNAGSSRRVMLQGALSAGVLASSGALNGIFTPASAAEPVIDANTMNRQWVLASHAEDAISEKNFAFREQPLGDKASLKEGELLVRNIVFTPLPSQRIRMHADTGLGDAYMAPMKLNQPIGGSGVGRVVKSSNPKFPVGALVASGNWEDYTVVRPNSFVSAPIAAGISAVDYASVYGMNTQTAYYGMMRIGQVKAGETVIVSGASGSVGSTAIQIAKINGARVIGIAGGKEKCAKLIRDYGIDAAIDYKSENITARVKELAPKGVDIYFDNVGGPIMQDVVDQMAKFGRVVLCGTISSYDNKNPAPGPRNMLRMVVYSVKLQGMLYTDFMAERDTIVAELRKWKESGQLKHKTDIRKGFKNLPETFMALFSGDKDGTLLLKNDGEA
ncbi:MAG: NADP-dependent oxidoreductase [Rhodospirillaceae bacterium]|nr:NADP-dependent oxidoreductase [Rhodospirillaceae bacterium]